MHAAASMARVRRDLGDRNCVSVRRATGVYGNKPTGLNDAVERAPIHNEIFNQRKCFCAPRLNRDSLPILEMSHVKLAGSRAALAAMRDSVDDERTHTANAFAAIRVERNRLLSALDQSLVHHVEHFQKGHIFEDIRCLVSFEAPGHPGILLPPNFESQIHL